MIYYSNLWFHKHKVLMPKDMLCFEQMFPHYFFVKETHSSTVNVTVATPAAPPPACLNR